jgi:hypothetical protein
MKGFFGLLTYFHPEIIVSKAVSELLQQPLSIDPW